MPTWFLGLFDGSSPLGAVVNKVLAFIPDPAERAKQQFALQQAAIQIAQQEAQGQLDANKTEAASASVFVAGWRPLIGWVCGAGLAWGTFIAPTLVWFFGLIGHPTPLPQIDQGSLNDMLYGLLGMAGWRTADKVAGVDTKAVGGLGLIGQVAKKVIKR